MRCGLVTVLEGGLEEAPPKELEHVVVPEAVVSLAVVVDSTLLCLEDNSRLLDACDRLPLDCLPPLRGGTTFELFAFLTGALDGLRRVPEVPFVWAARISGAIRAMSGREFGADTIWLRRLPESVEPVRSRSMLSGSLKWRKRLMEARTHELTTAVALLRASRSTVSLFALQRTASS